MDVDNLRCNECEFYRVDADRNESLCKRIDHKRVKFAVPWFKSYDCDHGCICSDFKPVEYYPAVYKNWQEVGGFKKWWPLWVEQWLPYKNTDVLSDTDSTTPFDVDAEYKGWTLKADFDRWCEKYKTVNKS